LSRALVLLEACVLLCRYKQSAVMEKSKHVLVPVFHKPLLVLK